jgi:DNA polymerase III alpha subunit
MIRTGYSFRLAVGHTQTVVDRLAELSWPAAPICDRDNTFGFVTWTKICKAANLRPVYGVEIAVSDNWAEKKSKDGSRQGPRIDHWSFLAKSDLAKLNDLVRLASGHAHRHPILSYDEAMSAPGLIKIAGEHCDQSLIDYDLEDVYQAVTPATPVALIRAAKDRGAVLVGLSRNVFPREADLEFYRVMLGRYLASTQTYHQHIVSDEELRGCQRLVSVDWDAAIAKREAILAECTASLRTAELLKYHSDVSLRDLCVRGAASLGVDLNDAVYAERLDRELSMISEKRFEDYFFIIADLVAWAKPRMVVGPARGSSCGSLVCYLLGITAIDPLPHDLIFERFIDITRADLPDIDLDFSDKHRDEVMAYAEQKYGDRVARLASVAIFQARSTLARVGTALNIPTWQVNKVAETAFKRMMGDSRKSSTIADTLAETEAGKALISEFPEALIAAKFDGHPDHSGIHAAGLVVTDKPVTTYVAVDMKTKTAMCNKYDAESLNLLKIDVLGLTQLSIFERTLELIGQNPVSGWLEKIPTDDPAAFEVLNKHRYCGVFQFTGNAMRGLARQIQFDSLDDIVAATALVRPGPLSSGGTSMWVERRSGRAATTYPHPLLKEYLEETLGVPVYQEQILRIGREVGDLSWADVTALRKAMSKSLGKEYFDQFGERWKANAILKGLPAEVASKFWDEMCQFGAWAFNKAHSVSYAYVSYWCAYLKAHYPLQFAAATLDAETKPERQIELLRELAEEGMGYVAVDPCRSTDRWEPGDDGSLVGPLTNIKGIGPAKFGVIMDARAGKRPMPTGLAKLMEDPKTPIDSLYPIRDWIAKKFPDGLETVNIFTTPTQVIDCQPGVAGAQVIIVTPTRLVPKDENEPVKVARRGGKVLTGPIKALNMFVRDDSDEMFAKIGRFKFEEYGREVQEEGKPGKVIYALKGVVPETFRMLDVYRVKKLGYME